MGPIQMVRKGVRMNKKEIIIDGICAVLGFAAFYVAFCMAAILDYIHAAGL